jgi:hypothetical protein
MPPKLTSISNVGETDEVIPTITSMPRYDEATPIEFRIVPRPGFLVVPQMRILDRFQVLKVDPQGKKHQIVEDDQVCLINFAGMTRYKLIEIYLNQTLITRTHYLHPLIAYLRALTEYTQFEKDFTLKRAGWFPDRTDAIAINEDRQKLTCQPSIEMLTPLMVDVFNHKQPFPDDVEITIRMFRAPLQYVINGAPEPGWHFEINMLSAELLITRLELERGKDVYSSIPGGTIMYSYPAYDPRQFIIPAGVFSVNEEILDGLPLPEQIVVLYLQQEAYNGAYENNPFNFDHLFTKEVSLRRDDLVDIPAMPYKFDTIEITGDQLSDDLTKFGQPLLAKRSVASGANKRHKRNTSAASEQNNNIDTVSAHTPSATDEEVMPDHYFVQPGPPPKRKRQATSMSMPDPGAIQIVDDALKRKHNLLKLGNYARSYAEFMKGLGNWKNTKITYWEFTNGKFIQAFDTRVDRSPEPGELPPMQPQKVSLRFQAKFQYNVLTPYIMLVLHLNRYTYSISRGGRIKQTS